jgi:hypothetical protein
MVKGKMGHVVLSVTKRSLPCALLALESVHGRVPSVSDSVQDIPLGAGSPFGSRSLFSRNVTIHGQVRVPDQRTTGIPLGEGFLLESCLTSLLEMHLGGESARIVPREACKRKTSRNALARRTDVFGDKGCLLDGRFMTRSHELDVYLKLGIKYLKAEELC